MEKVLFVTGLTEIAATDLEGVGVIRQSGDCFFRWVQNKNTTALTVGMIAYHKAADLGNMHSKVYDFITAAIANRGLMAGVVMADSLTADYYGWIQIWGPNASCNFYSSGAPILAGDMLQGVITSGAVPTTSALGGDSLGVVPLTQDTLTDNTGGSASTTLVTLATITSAADVTIVKNSFTSLAAQLAKIQADIATLRLLNHNVVALQALTTGITVATAKRGFIRCM